MVSAANFQAHERGQAMAQPNDIRHSGASTTTATSTPSNSVFASGREWLIAVIETAINIFDEEAEEEDIFAPTYATRKNPQWPGDQ